jgi:hypothetical protein
VEARGFEPLTPAMRTQCSPAELRPHDSTIIRPPRSPVKSDRSVGGIQSAPSSSVALRPAFAVRRRKSAITSSSASPYPAQIWSIEMFIPE